MGGAGEIIDVATLIAWQAALPWAGWYAQPMASAAASQLSRQLREAEQAAFAANASAFVPRLGLLITGYWQHRAVELDYRSLQATCRPEQGPLVELVYGQLLISCKRSGAYAHLQRGFQAAASQIPATDYFTLLKRHELLQWLPLTAAGVAPATLADLLTEAKVIKRLQEKPRRG